LAGDGAQKTGRCFGLRGPPLLYHPESTALPHQACYASSIVPQELLGLTGPGSPSVTLTPHSVVNASSHQNASASASKYYRDVSLQLAVFRFQLPQHGLYPETQKFQSHASHLRLWSTLLVLEPHVGRHRVTQDNARAL